MMSTFGQTEFNEEMSKKLAKIKRKKEKARLEHSGCIALLLTCTFHIVL